jgi:DNA helicase HerA-like ATPase
VTSLLDSDLPKLVFLFDEGHLLFEDAPKALVDKIEQVVRRIRSKGVGGYFMTQSSPDVRANLVTGCSMRCVRLPHTMSRL